MNYTKQLKIASTRINSSSDLLTEEIAALEATINSFNLGVSLFIAIEPFDLYLGYAKVNNSWGFAVKLDCDSEPQKLRDVRRETRIELIPFVPSLLEELISEVHTTSAVIEQASKKLSTLRESLQ